MSKIQSFRDLLIWQKSMDLSLAVYRETMGFPQEERYGLTSQVRRSAVSVPSNITEGYGRQSRTDYNRFLEIGRGSLYELQTQLELARELDNLEAEEWERLEDSAAEIERMMSSLINKLTN